jgi:cytochrome b
MRTWDLPTRLFKWSFVLLVFAAPLAKWYGDASFLAHRMIGYMLLTLLLWRVFWGFFGGELSRFTHFFPTPQRVFTHLKNPQETLGHNPLGSLMILALLGLVFVQASLGLFASDEIATDGPFMHLWPQFMGFATKYHHKLFWLLVALAGLHIGVNLFYQFVKKQPLITQMITGKSDKQARPEPHQGSVKLAFFLFILSVTIVFGGLKVFGQSAFI